MAGSTTLLLFGASGDLASRLLLPALGQLLAREPDRRLRLVGVGTSDWDDTAWRKVVRRAFKSSSTERMLDHLDELVYRRADITKVTQLRAVLREQPADTAVYFAVPPAVAASACESLKPGDLPADAVLALEKPFGSDAASAHELNDTLRRLVPESRVFRVDHFLGRSTLLNVLGVRFANVVVEPVWSADDVASVAVRFDESLGLEGRAGYYDGAGAMIDMIQSHLLQVLAILAMEPPASLDEADLRDATSAALRATAVWDDNPVHSSRRARYTAGRAGGEELPSYVDEPGVDPTRDTETLAEVTFEVRTARWTGVPFTLRSGKAIGEPRDEIVVVFRPVRHLPAGLTGTAEGAVLRFELGPDRMSLELNVNGSDDPFALRRANLSADLGEGTLRAYAEVLAGILDGDAALSVRGDAAEQCWRIIQPVRDAWARGDVPLEEYEAGSAGPVGWPDRP